MATSLNDNGTMEHQSIEQNSIEQSTKKSSWTYKKKIIWLFLIFSFAFVGVAIPLLLLGYVGIVPICNSICIGVGWMLVALSIMFGLAALIYMIFKKND
jgi:hypothetical protein